MTLRIYVSTLLEILVMKKKKFRLKILKPVSTLLEILGPPSLRLPTGWRHVSTLLEILDITEPACWEVPKQLLFQPFLRF